MAKIDSILVYQIDTLERMDLLAWMTLSSLAICSLTLLLVIIVAWRMK